MEEKGEFCKLDPHSEDILPSFKCLKDKGCKLYYFSTDNGRYWDQSGKHQRLYDAIYRYVPWSGYPKVEMYDHTASR